MRAVGGEEININDTKIWSDSVPTYDTIVIQ